MASRNCARLAVLIDLLRNVRLERDPHPQLQLARIQSGCNLSKAGITHISINGSEVGVIEDIDEIDTQLEVASFSEPGQMIILEHTGINLQEPRVAINVPSKVPFRTNRGLRKIAYVKETVYVSASAMRTTEALTRCVGNVVVRSVHVVIPAVGSH